LVNRQGLMPDGLKLDWWVLSWCACAIGEYHFCEIQALRNVVSNCRKRCHYRYDFVSISSKKLNKEALSVNLESSFVWSWDLQMPCVI
jgi:hypothetical protein